MAKKIKQRPEFTTVFLKENVEKIWMWNNLHV